MRAAGVTILILAVWGFSACGTRADETDPQPAEQSEASFDKLVQQLDSDKFSERQAATSKLIEIGKPAVPAVAEAAKSESNEVSTRAFEILERLKAGSGDTADAAKEALQKLAQDKNDRVRRRAENVLAPPADRQADIGPGGIQIGRPGIQILPQPVPLGGQIQIQARVVAGGGNRKVIQAQNINGVKKINVQDGDKKIVIEEDPDAGIKVEVTEKVEGKDKTSRYEAKTLEELKKNHPEAAKLYDEYAGKQGVQIQIQPQPLRQLQPVPPIGGPQRNAAQPAEQIKAARKQLKLALEALQQPDAPDAEALKKLQAQLEEANRQLAEAEKQLER